MKLTFQAVFEHVVNRAWLLFSLFWLLIILLCLPAYKAGMNGDFEGLLDFYNHSNFLEFINSKGFNVKSLYQITHLQLFTFIKLFGIRPWPWFLILTGLHAINALLIFVFCRRFFDDFKLPKGLIIALFGSLLFLTNPNFTEITIWKGGYHYLTAILSQMSLLLWTQSYLKTGKKKWVLYSVILFAVSCFSLELFYLSPWYCLVLMIAYYWKGLVNKERFKQTITKIFLSQIFLFIGYLLLFHYRFGVWMAHYGSTGDFQFSLEAMLPRLPKYLFTILGFSAHLPFELSSKIYAFCDQQVFYYSFFTILLILAGLVLIYFKRMNTMLQVCSLFFGLMMMSALIIIPIYFDDVVQVYNSRRCYQIGIPVYLLLNIFCFSFIKNKTIAISLMTLYLLLGMGFAFKKAFHWRDANQIQKALLWNFKWQNEEKQILILNMPCYYKDVRVIPFIQWDDFQENLMVFGYDTCKKPNDYVSSYNMINTWDGAHVVLQDSMTLKVTLNQWGSWWMYALNGAKDRETENYKLEMKDVGHEYILHLKKPAKQFLILYQQGEQWKVVDDTKTPQEEQW